MDKTVGAPWADAEPQAVWAAFYEISQIPRCSGREEAVLRYLKSQAQSLGLESVQDATGNLIIRKPATQGREKAPGLVLQGHVDMVCEKNEGTCHDFEKDPIQLLAEGDWLKAQGTTLGADNGIAVAYMLAVLRDKTLAHGPLECLFTVDEETGLTGAKGLEAGLLRGAFLLNLDSEDEGRFTIGCAGGGTCEGHLPLERQKSTSTAISFQRGQLHLRGLSGGHSGVEIHKGTPNALQWGIRVLLELKERGLWSGSLVSLSGGNKHNAIPREFFCTLEVEDPQRLKSGLESVRKELEKESGLPAGTLDLGWTPLDSETAAPWTALTLDCTRKVLEVLSLIPHGVQAMSPLIPGLVDSSSNFAALKTYEDHLVVLTSHRSTHGGHLKELLGRMERLFRLTGGSLEIRDPYPAWTPAPQSRLREVCLKLWEKVHGQPAVLEVIHAGLECGLIGEKYPGMEMISLGPDIRGAHTPEEKISLTSVKKVWIFLREFLQSFL